MADNRPSCEHELNRQLKLLKSRIDQTDKNVQSMYLTNCQLVQSLLSDPYTSSGVGPIASAIYGVGEAGWALMVELWNAIQIPSITDLTIRLAIEIASKIVDEMFSILEQILVSVLQAVNAVINQIFSVVQLIATLEQQLINAVGAVRDGIVRQINALKTVLVELRKALNEVINTNILTSDMITAHLNIAGCKTTSLRVG